MSKRRIVAAMLVVTALAIGATQATGAKHSHGVLMNYVSIPLAVPAGGVGSAVVICPTNSIATGGGVNYVDGLGVIAGSGFETTDSYSAIIDNFRSSVSSDVDVQVACVAGTSRVRAREASAEQVKDQLQAEVASIKAAHRKAASTR